MSEYWERLFFQLPNHTVKKSRIFRGKADHARQRFWHYVKKRIGNWHFFSTVKSVSVSVSVSVCNRRIDRHPFQEGRRVCTAADEHQWLQLSAVCASYNIGEGGGCHCVLEEEDSTGNQPSSKYPILEAWRAVFCLCELCGGSRSANLA